MRSLSRIRESIVYVNSMNCMMFDVFGVWLSMGAPRIHKMLGFNQTMHVHYGSHFGIAPIDKGITPCMFVEVDHVDYLVSDSVMLGGYAKA